MGEIRGITNINILGQTYYYDEEKELVGFPLWYNKNINSLDYRVGHQYWIPKEQAKAIVQRVLEQEWSKNNKE